jgi:hypothetical protein
MAFSWRSHCARERQIAGLPKYFLKGSMRPIMAKRLQPLKTFKQVVDALGGPVAVGRITDQSCAAVCNWRSYHGLFPCKYYPTIQDALEPLGFTASMTLFNFHNNEKQNTKAA